MSLKRRRWTDRERDVQLRYRYGIDLKDYEDMKRKQGGVCAICGKAETKRWLAVDHCHGTGLVRGLLCLTCNTALGWYERHWLEVQRYLERGE